MRDCRYLFAFLALAIAPLAVAVGLRVQPRDGRGPAEGAIRSWVLIPAIAAAGLVTGICSIWWPELPGNGRSILTVSVNSGLTLGAAAVILLLKPLLTALFLRAGAVGGCSRPPWPRARRWDRLPRLRSITLAGTRRFSVPAVSLTCAAGVLAITQRAPVFAAMFVWELARPPYWLLIVFAVAAYAAHGLRLLRERGAKLLLRSLDPLAGVADDADRHGAGQADVLHAGTGGDDRGVLQDRQHGRHVPQPRFDGGDHVVDVLRCRRARRRSSAECCGRRCR